jgi:hypothetical protein
MVTTDDYSYKPGGLAAAAGPPPPPPAAAAAHSFQQLQLHGGDHDKVPLLPSPFLTFSYHLARTAVPATASSLSLATRASSTRPVPKSLLAQDTSVIHLSFLLLTRIMLSNRHRQRRKNLPLDDETV